MINHYNTIYQLMSQPSLHKQTNIDLFPFQYICKQFRTLLFQLQNYIYILKSHLFLPNKKKFLFWPRYQFLLQFHTKEARPLTNHKTLLTYLNIKQIMSVLIQILLLAVGSIVSVSSLTTLQYTFNNSADSVYRYPTYYLGLIPGNSTVYFSMEAIASNTDLANSVVQLVIGTSNTLVNAFTCSGTSCSDTYYIASDSNLLYSFRVYYSFPPNILPPSFQPYQLIINRYPGQPSTQQSPPNTEKLVKVVDAVRIGVNKYIYIDGSKEMQLTMRPIPAPLISPDEAFRLAPVNPENGWTMDYNSLVPLADKGLVGQLYKFAGNVSQGYYALLVTYDVNMAPLKISWQTDLYTCNYSQSYTDYFSIYQGCFINKMPSPEGLPCLAFDPPTQMCKACMVGFYLNSQGFCITNNTCPPRQYFHFGQCFPVSSLCGDFDRNTGACLTCINQASYYLANGTCINKVITCQPRQYIFNLACVDVSPTCGTFDASNGNCLTCLNSTYFRVAGGVCEQIRVQCSPGYYKIGLNCYLTPSQCLQFDTSRARCSQCITGYNNQNGTCVKVTCRAGFYFSLQAANCTQVSSLCQQYDPLNGNCMSCSLPGYTVFNGKCLQSISSLAGCTQRQQLGFGPCVDASVNCQIYNLITGNCDKCAPRYFLDYTGRCSEQANCSTGYWNINGDCLRFPQNCLRVDQVGLCVQCISSNYRIILGQCVYNHVCAARQFLNPSFQCVDVDSACDQFNPSNGGCISCKDSNAILSSGVCCVFDSLNLNRKCVDPSKISENTEGPKCMVYHPTLGYCLRCSRGYKPDFSTRGCQKQ